MTKELEALKRFREYTIGTLAKLICRPYLYYLYDIIEKGLKRLEKLEKDFDRLSKEDEKAKKLLSLEIEKNRKLQIIEEKFDIDVFEMGDLDEKAEYIIDIRPKPNKHSNMSGNSLTKEEYESISGQSVTLLNKEDFE